MNRIPSGGKMEYQSSFVGFFPEDAPVYSVACMVYTGPTGQSHGYDDLSKKIACEFVREWQESESVK